MTPVHRDPEFAALLRIVAAERGLSPGLVEKDYWVTQTLHDLLDAGFDIWFKGGTSLSKAFGLIERFSEDLNLKVLPGSVAALGPEPKWSGNTGQACRRREEYLRRLASLIGIPDAKVSIDEGRIEPQWRSVNIRIEYPGRYLDALGGSIVPFVLLEIGSARVTPFVLRGLTSFVQEYLQAKGMSEIFTDHSVHGLRCVHPCVTLLEKLDAIHRRFAEDALPASTFVRHYEDAARIIMQFDTLSPLDGYQTAEELALEMCREKQLRQVPSLLDPAFKPDEGTRWKEIHRAHDQLGPIFWGERVSLGKACDEIRNWVKKM
jgi:hypothetical protein